MIKAIQIDDSMIIVRYENLDDAIKLYNFFVADKNVEYVNINKGENNEQRTE